MAFSSNGVRPLTRLVVGRAAEIVEIARANEGRTEKLISLGVTPGARVTVLQTFPGVVFLCDQTELAVERGVAESILVRPIED